MSDATRFPPILPLQTPNSLFLPSNRLGFSNTKSSRSVADLWGSLNINNELNTGWCLKAISDLGQQGSVPVLDYSSSSPVSVDLKPILNECEFDRVVDEAHRVDESVIVLWMAKWCRKCIYLKPKLEKLAAVYHPRVKFYCIDVNNVPHQLVVRAGVTKMPTIQLWKDGKKQGEVIGGHKAYLVANEVREMIDDEGQP